MRAPHNPLGTRPTAALPTKATVDRHRSRLPTPDSRRNTGTPVPGNGIPLRSDSGNTSFPLGRAAGCAVRESGPAARREKENAATRNQAASAPPGADAARATPAGRRAPAQCAEAPAGTGLMTSFGFTRAGPRSAPSSAPSRPALSVAYVRHEPTPSTIPATSTRTASTSPGRTPGRRPSPGPRRPPRTTPPPRRTSRRPRATAPSPHGSPTALTCLVCAPRRSTALPSASHGPRAAPAGLQV